MTQTRLTIYLAAFFGGIAVILAMLGAATYDHASGLLDIRPFNVNWLAGIIAGPMASGMAAVMVWVQGRGK